MFPQLFEKEYYYAQDYQNEITVHLKSKEDMMRFYLYDLATSSFYIYGEHTILKISCQATF